MNNKQLKNKQKTTKLNEENKLMNRPQDRQRGKQRKKKIKHKTTVAATKTGIPGVHGPSAISSISLPCLQAVAFKMQ